MSTLPELPGYDPRDHEPHVRATDAEREAVSAMVRQALDDGRLQLDEVDERLGAVYSAKTHGDLATVVNDIVPYLPPRMVAPPPSEPPAPTGPSNKKILPAFLLGVPFGVFGAHRFYAGQFNTAVAMLVLTMIGIGAPFTVLWWLYDMVVLAMGKFHDGRGRRMVEWV